MRHANMAKPIVMFVFFTCLVGDWSQTMWAAAEPPTSGRRDEIPWQLLKNPVLGREDWAIKDHCIIQKNGYFYLTMARRYGDKPFQPEGSWNRTHKKIELYRCHSFQSFDWRPAGFMHEGRDTAQR
jgi:hypothetical protein